MLLEFQVGFSFVVGGGDGGGEEGGNKEVFALYTNIVLEESAKVAKCCTLLLSFVGGKLHLDSRGLEIIWTTKTTTCLDQSNTNVEDDNR